jgi:hypothetical protein
MKKGKLTAEQIEASAWAAGLARPIVEDEVPRGWLTARALAKKLNKAEKTTSTLLRAAVADGRAERQSFRIITGACVRLVPHYKLR